MISNNPKFFYLNIGGRWPNFKLTDLEIAADGALQLRALPRLTGQAPESLADLPPPDAPSGLARTEDGAIFFSEPEKHRLWRIDPCDPEKKPQVAACLGGEGGDATQFNSPRGLLSLPGRGLLVADSGNNRIQLVDPLILQVREIWDGFNAQGIPVLHEPWAMALDGKNNVYVVVAGDRSLQKLDFWGRVDHSFRKNLGASYQLVEPVATAVAAIDGEESLLVLDRKRRALVVFDLSGNWQKTFLIDEIQSPLTLEVSERAIYIGDNGERHRTVLLFDPPSLEDWRLNFIGSAVGYFGPVAAILLDCPATGSEVLCGNGELTSKASRPCDLLVLAGGGLPPIEMKESLGFRAAGFAVAGPFDYRRRPVAWHRLQAFAESLPAHAHLNLFFKFGESQTGAPPQTPPVTNGGSPPSGLFEGWCAFPPDATEGIFESFAAGNCLAGSSTPGALKRRGGSPATSTYLWLGLKFSGDGAASPRVAQMRLEFDYASYLPYLPALYSEDIDSRRFLLPLLSLVESLFVEQETAIGNMPELFDPYAAPPEYLAWLAGWLAADIEEEWSDDRKRLVIAEAFASYAQRGTPAGLQRALRLFANADAHVLEPLNNADLWSLGETSTLDFDTMLAPAEAQGAVLGTTATLDRSHLITDAEFGAPLFDDVAHRFAVVVYPNAAGSPQQLAKIKAVVEREKPAHTDYQLCVIRPSMRVGFQSTVGIDTVVGGQEPPTPLESSTGGLILAGTPLAGLGEGSQVGINTQLS